MPRREGGVPLQASPLERCKLGQNETSQELVPIVDVATGGS